MRKFIINVNGNSYEVEVEEVETGSASPVSKIQGSSMDSKVGADAPAAQAEQKPKAAPTPKAQPKPEVQASGGQETVEAPMPGNIWKLMVKEGDTVNEGDVLLILEAMKMENEILAPKSGTIIAVNTTEGSTVSAGDKLVILE